MRLPLRSANPEKASTSVPKPGRRLYGPPCPNPETRSVVVQRGGNMAKAVETKALIEKAGIRCPIVTGGSTGTWRERLSMGFPAPAPVPTER